MNWLYGIALVGLIVMSTRYANHPPGMEDLARTLVALSAAMDLMILSRQDR